MKAAGAVEHPLAHECVHVGVPIEEGSEGLRRGDHGGHRALEMREARAEMIADDGVGRTAELAEEQAVMAEVRPEHLRDGEHDGGVGNAGEYFKDSSNHYFTG